LLRCFLEPVLGLDPARMLNRGNRTPAGELVGCPRQNWAEQGTAIAGLDGWFPLKGGS